MASRRWRVTQTNRRRGVSAPSVEAGADDGTDHAPAETVSRQSAVSSATLRERWADPAWRARIAAGMAARWQDPAYRERARGFHRDDASYRWRHLPSGRVVTRTKAEMREEFGLKRDALSLLVAGATKSSQGWALEPKPRMPPGPRWIFP